MRGHLNVHKSVGGISRAALAIGLAVLMSVFLTAYSIGSSTASPHKTRLIESSKRSLATFTDQLQRCEYVQTTKNGDRVTAEQAIAELEQQDADAVEALRLEKERLASLRPVVQKCKDDLAGLRKSVFGAPEANITAHLAEMQRKRDELIEQHDVLTNTKEVYRRTDLLTLQSALVQQLVALQSKARGAAEEVTRCDVSPHKYSVVFDLGSSGNRVHVYKYAVTALTTAPGAAGAPSTQRDLISEIELTEELFELNHKALSKLPDPLAEAPGALRELFDKAKAFVPADVHYCTPVEFKATAGLRMLGAEKATQILAEIHRAYRNESFWMRGSAPVRILHGSEEGPMAWLTVNFLLGAFGKTNTNSTVAVIDLGGGSTQVVFEPHGDAFDAVPPSQRFHTQLGSRSVKAYQHSYEGFGLHSATRELLFNIQGKCQDRPPAPSPATTTTTTTEAAGGGGGVLGNLFGGGGGGKAAEGREGDDDDDEGDVTEAKAAPAMDAVAMEAFPCFAVGYRDAVGVSNTKMTESGAPVTAPNFTACVDLFRDRLLKPAAVPCRAAHCGIQHVFQPPFANFTGDIYAFSFIFDLLDAANESALAVSSEKFVATLPDFARVGAARCSALTVERIQAAGASGSLQPAYDCLYYSYAYALLRYGYGIAEDRPLHVAKKIRGYETAWTLGASLVSLA